MIYTGIGRRLLNYIEKPNVVGVVFFSSKVVGLLLPTKRTVFGFNIRPHLSTHSLSLSLLHYSFIYLVTLAN